jgi:hypothetical protein
MGDIRADAGRALRVLVECRRAAAELGFVERQLLADAGMWTPEELEGHVSRALKQAGVAVSRAYIAFIGPVSVPWEVSPGGPAPADAGDHLPDPEDGAFP